MKESVRPCPADSVCLFFQCVEEVLAEFGDFDFAETDITNWFNFELDELANSAAVLYDRATNWLDCSPKAAGSEEHIIESMQ